MHVVHERMYLEVYQRNQGTACYIISYAHSISFSGKTASEPHISGGKGKGEKHLVHKTILRNHSNKIIVSVWTMYFLIYYPSCYQVYSASSSLAALVAYLSCQILISTILFHDCYKNIQQLRGIEWCLKADYSCLAIYCLLWLRFVQLLCKKIS